MQKKQILLLMSAFLFQGMQSSNLIRIDESSILQNGWGDNVIRDGLQPSLTHDNSLLNKVVDQLKDPENYKKVAQVAGKGITLAFSGIDWSVNHPKSSVVIFVGITGVGGYVATKIVDWNNRRIKNNREAIYTEAEIDIKTTGTEVTQNLSDLNKAVSALKARLEKGNVSVSNDILDELIKKTDEILKPQDTSDQNTKFNDQEMEEILKRTEQSEIKTSQNKQKVSGGILLWLKLFQNNKKIQKKPLKNPFVVKKARFNTKIGKPSLLFRRLK